MQALKPDPPTQPEPHPQPQPRPGQPSPPTPRALEKLWAYVDRGFPCHCEPAYTERNRHASDCQNDTAHDVVAVLLDDGLIRTEAFA